jgi:hypothetical protein
MVALRCMPLTWGGVADEARLRCRIPKPTGQTETLERFALFNS